MKLDKGSRSISTDSKGSAGIPRYRLLTGSEASIPADFATGKPGESNGLSVLDVVKHSLRTIVTTMQEGD